MPKKIQKKVSKAVKVKKSKFQFKFVYLLILFLPLAIWYGYKQLVQQPDVYQVVESGSNTTKPISSMTYDPGTGLITVKLNPSTGGNAVADRVVLYWSDKIPPLAVAKDSWVDWAYALNNTKTLNLKTATPQKGTENVTSNIKGGAYAESVAREAIATRVVTFQRKPSEFILPGSFGIKLYRLTSDFLTLDKGAAAGETWEVVDQIGLNPQTDFTNAPTPTPIQQETPKPTSTAAIPANCISWFDGCNRCMVKNGVLTGCTMMACKVSTEAPRCLEYSGSTPTPVATIAPRPSGCYEVMPDCPEGKACIQVMKLVCPTPTSSATSKPSPTSIGSSCTQKIASITFKDQCGAQGFTSVTYQCDSGETKSYSDGCMDASAMYDKVRGLCGDTCTSVSAPAK